MHRATAPDLSTGRRRTAYLVGLVLGLPAVVTSGVVNWDDPVRRWVYPAVGMVLLAAAVVMLLRPRWLPAVERVTLGVATCLWLARVVHEVLVAPTAAEAWVAVTPWGFMGVVAIALFAYVVLPSRRAVVFAVLLSGVFVATLAARVVPQDAATGDTTLSLALLRYCSYLGIAVAFVHLLSLTKDDAVGAEVEADRMRSMAYRDPLTGLPNRRALSELLEREVDHARRTPLSLVAFDLDEFKQVNDGFGHHAGDLVLQAAGMLLQKELRSEDTLGRWGGEEFVVVCPGTSGRQAVELAQRLRRVLADHLHVEGHVVTASFGVVQYVPGMSVASLLEAADERMYAAKAAGRNRVDFGAAAGGGDAGAVTCAVVPAQTARDVAPDSPPEAPPGSPLLHGPATAGEADAAAGYPSALDRSGVEGFHERP
ncbi:GGDEF domain-containing protein [Thalassiella azotivora]